MGGSSSILSPKNLLIGAGLIGLGAATGGFGLLGGGAAAGAGHSGRRGCGNRSSCRRCGSRSRCRSSSGRSSDKYAYQYGGNRSD